MTIALSVVILGVFAGAIAIGRRHARSKSSFQYLIGINTALCMAMLVAIVMRPGLAADLMVAAPLVAVVVFGVWRAIQTRHAGPDDPDSEQTFRNTFMIAFTISALWFTCGGAGVFFLVNSGRHSPDPSSFLPAPQSLKVNQSDLGCGSQVCGVSFEVTGTSGQSPAELLAQVLNHLHERGWSLTAGGEECRQVGFIIDRRTQCITVTPHDDKVSVSLQANKGL